MDDIDRANDYAEQMRELALKEHFRRRLHTSSKKAGRLRPGCCLDCGIPIPELCLSVRPDAVRCILCQIEHEMMLSRRKI